MEQYIFLAICYILGSIPFGLFAGFAAGKDIRREGSGNIGFTNVLRVCGKGWGIPVLVTDIAKGFVPVFFIAPAMVGGAENPGLWTALGAVMCVIGHSFPAWLKFKGGKGVATGAGVLAALMWFPFVCGLLVWGILVAVSRYISLGSVFGPLVIVAVRVYQTREDIFSANNFPATLIALLIALLVIIRHRSNIARLLNGTENKLGAKKSAVESPEDLAEQSTAQNT